MWLLMLFALLTVLWSLIGRVDIVATAQGRVIPSDRTKTIQAAETATVTAIHVLEGQLVKTGDVLIELDSTITTADRDSVASSLQVTRLKSARAKAMLKGIKTGRVPRIEAIDGIDSAEIKQEQQWLEGQFAELSAQRGQIDADITRKNAELNSTQELVNSLEQTLPIERQRTEDLEKLAAGGYVARHEHLERRQVWLDKEGELANQRSRLAELRASVLETQERRRTLLAEARRVALDSFNDAEQKGMELTQELVKADARGRLMRLISPVDGAVQQLDVHTIGGVVTPAQPLMMIVPQGESFEVEAFLENKDVGFVRAGQTAEVKVETFQFTKYGTIHGTVENVSQDAINDEKRGLIYSMRVKIERAALQVEDRLASLAPGMSVTVEVKTGKRRVIEYFLSPLLQYQDESLRER